MTERWFLVSADHVHPDYQFKATETRVRQTNDGTWYATHPKLGCGKDYATPQIAIAELFGDHACTFVRVVGEKASGRA